QAETKRKDVVAFEKEGALLWKEEWKPREIRPSRVDLGLGEVGIGGRRRQHIRADPLRHVETWLKLPIDRRRRRGHAGTRCDGRPQTQSETEVRKRQIGEQAGPA